ncbi:hypothetical protein HS1genome_0922 [Sulfodiicoccus acidiphilus]|uniref:GS beta-grasp domain-containing protein n=1 Tax=Sulfodiicoccus acidiphilus TaxID=1670455 RepID=A0A348B2Y1_9CREN|nr:hypothetical protein HS1genome_0922 [Sulfodiicoccus acidiphilus]
MNSTIEKSLKLVRENQIEWLDLQFTDLPGRLHHITIPAKELTEESFKTGFGKLDGSSIRGFTTIYESDMVLRPVPETTALLPWNKGVARVLNQVFWGAGRVDSKETRGVWPRLRRRSRNREG